MFSILLKRIKKKQIEVVLQENSRYFIMEFLVLLKIIQFDELNIINNQNMIKFPNFTNTRRFEYNKQ